MLDVSRAAVLKLSRIKDLIKHMALLGLNTLQLYTEDIFKLDNEPFFGFNRGGYSVRDLKEIDSFADMFGIEAFPCIQTLGHLGQVLQWPAYSNLRE